MNDNKYTRIVVDKIKMVISLFLISPSSKKNSIEFFKVEGKGNVPVATILEDRRHS